LPRLQYLSIAHCKVSPDTLRPLGKALQARQSVIFEITLVMLFFYGTCCATTCELMHTSRLNHVRMCAAFCALVLGVFSCMV
jgi:hypothetical protein